MRFPADSSELDGLIAMPGGEIVNVIADQITSVAREISNPISAIGVAVPGVVRHGIVEEAPNLVQSKGMRLADELKRVLTARGVSAPVYIANDADAIAAGVAATRGQLDRLTRVWTIGNGIGYGRWPYVEGVWEGGHITVTLDPKERFCGCGGVGHLEGITGYRAMRMRFSISNRKKFLRRRNRETSAAVSLSISGIALLPPARPRSSTSPARAGSTSPATTWASWTCRRCAHILKLW